MQRAQGDLPAALTSYQASLAISDRLAKADPGNAGWQRDLSVSHNKIGDVQRAQGDLPAALTSYQASLAISERLAKADPGNAGWQRDLSVSHDRIGDVQRAQGDLPAALTSYQASLAISDRLAKADPGNAGWQRDLAVSYGRMAFGRSAGRGTWRRTRFVPARTRHHRGTCAAVTRQRDPTQGPRVVRQPNRGARKIITLSIQRIAHSGPFRHEVPTSQDHIAYRPAGPARAAVRELSFPAWCGLYQDKRPP